ncbi:gamma-glutamyl phosphate reductase, partial [Chiua virens]
MTTISDSSSYVEALAQNAKAAFEASQLLPSSVRETALKIIADELQNNKTSILDANQLDLHDAQQEVDAGRMSKPMLGRLDLGKPGKWDQMLNGVTDVARLPDPTGIVSYASELDDNLELYRVSCPIGVLLVIFEARPEVVVNIAALAIKSGNAAILKGGKESNRTTTELAKAISEGLKQASLPPTYIQTVQTRAQVSALLELDQYIDLVIPRGSNELVRNIQSNTRIPVMGHADGLCHVYLHQDADPDKAKRVVLDSKIDYPSACNAAETLLVHKSLLHFLWIDIAYALCEAGVQLFCDENTLSVLPRSIHRKHPDSIVRATEESYRTEHLDLKLSVKSMSSSEDSIKHYGPYSTCSPQCNISECDIGICKFKFDAVIVLAALFRKGTSEANVCANVSPILTDYFPYGTKTKVRSAPGNGHVRFPRRLQCLESIKGKVRGHNEAPKLEVGLNAFNPLKPPLSGKIEEKRVNLKRSNL